MRRDPPTRPSLQDVVGDASFLAGAPRRFLMEIALAPVGHGVAEHSRALKDPVGRARATTAYIYLVAFGTPEERAAVIRMVNKAHGPVRSREDEPVRYSAFDPRLQLWVAGCMYYGGRDLWQRLFGELDHVAQESLYREFRTYGTSLQVPEEAWPADHVEFDAYVSRTLDGIEIDDRVRTYGHMLLSPEGHPAPLRPAFRMLRFTTIGMLPPQLREAYHFPWSPKDQKRFDRIMAVSSAVYRRVPAALRRAPRDLILASSRRHVMATYGPDSLRVAPA